ncbi:sulfur carrier protein ThiS [Paenibacillus sp. UNC499MF]|uniref:sulfur carrier protein ThiS n=1 Tax=Paenibacillus sp. UNC499MF TaxID=1502751 RepID=UPI0008A0128F|nr:sulfur carrier protein ThiS [Paenibacillus sp. UNC499MF]SEG51184.1 sulfur carrier protein [Paenibacillus sp. UNC499MF]
MKLRINGDDITVPETVHTVEGLISHLGLKRNLLIVETNGHILQGEDHADAPVADGDRIEIVHFVGGG